MAIGHERLPADLLLLSRHRLRRLLLAAAVAPAPVCAVAGYLVFASPAWAAVPLLAGAVVLASVVGSVPRWDREWLRSRRAGVSALALLMVPAAVAAAWTDHGWVVLVLGVVQLCAAVGFVAFLGRWSRVVRRGDPAEVNGWVERFGGWLGPLRVQEAVAELGLPGLETSELEGRPGLRWRIDTDPGPATPAARLLLDDAPWRWELHLACAEAQLADALRGHGSPTDPWLVARLRPPFGGALFPTGVPADARSALEAWALAVTGAVEEARAVLPRTPPRPAATTTEGDTCWKRGAAHLALGEGEQARRWWECGAAAAGFGGRRCREQLARVSGEHKPPSASVLPPG